MGRTFKRTSYPVVIRQSKNELQRELHRANAALLVKRTQDAQRTCQRSRGLPKSKLTKIRINRSKIRVIEDVESLQ
jgi:hypothetical protein